MSVSGASWVEGILRRIGLDLGQSLEEVDLVRRASSPNCLGHGLRPGVQYDADLARSSSEELDSLDCVIGCEIECNSLPLGGFDGVVLSIDGRTNGSFGVVPVAHSSFSEELHWVAKGPRWFYDSARDLEQGRLWPDDSVRSQRLTEHFGGLGDAWPRSGAAEGGESDVKMIEPSRFTVVGHRFTPLSRPIHPTVAERRMWVIRLNHLRLHSCA